MGTGREIHEEIKRLKKVYDSIILIANSIGGFFSMNSEIADMVQKAYFISPIVDMELLICNMMKRANVSESEQRQKGEISTAFGEDLSWEYLCYIREHPIKWGVPTHILYGRNDELTAAEINEDVEDVRRVIEDYGLFDGDEDE